EEARNGAKDADVVVIGQGGGKSHAGLRRYAQRLPRPWIGASWRKRPGHASFNASETLSTSGSNVARSCCSMLLYIELERQICASEPNEFDPGAVNTVVEQLQCNGCRLCSLRRVGISWR